MLNIKHSFVILYQTKHNKNTYFCKTIMFWAIPTTTDVGVIDMSWGVNLVEAWSEERRGGELMSQTCCVNLND